MEKEYEAVINEEHIDKEYINCLKYCHIDRAETFQIAMNAMNFGDVMAVIDDAGNADIFLNDIHLGHIKKKHLEMTKSIWKLINLHGCDLTPKQKKIINDSMLNPYTLEDCDAVYFADGFIMETVWEIEARMDLNDDNIGYAIEDHDGLVFYNCEEDGEWRIGNIRQHVLGNYHPASMLEKWGVGRLYKFTDDQRDLILWLSMEAAKKCQLDNGQAFERLRKFDNKGFYDYMITHY